jgi:hypothetical protein
MRVHTTTFFTLLPLLAGASLGACSSKDDGNFRPVSQPPMTTSVTTGTGAGGMGGAGGSGGAGASGGQGGSGGSIPVSCMDGVKNGTESDIDCGGGDCSPCADGKKCAQGSDCDSKSCISGACAPATCTDGVQNGDETDVNCGGKLCNPCDPTKKCLVASDCSTGVCTGGICQQSTCNDNVKNGGETDVDCGGKDCPKCRVGLKCITSNDCASSNCDVFNTKICLCPTKMVTIPLSGGGTSCIDATEVTYADYKVFLDANPPLNQQPAYCVGWNQTYIPAQWPPPAADLYKPVVTVDFCDAYAYCKYAGKELCGKVGGGSVDPAAFDDFKQDAWYNACSAQGTNVYPYGDAFVSNACTGAPSSGSIPVWDPIQMKPIDGCQGGAIGLHQMSGNVAEWEDACAGAAGDTDTCHVRGGSYLSTMNALRCDADDTRARSYQGADVGFRCCL